MSVKLRSVGKVLLETLVIVAVAAALPKLMSWVLRTPYPLATITSSSMWPALKSGDLVVIKGCSAEELSPGEIVVYQSPEGSGMIIHRILEVDGGEIVTKGDANDEPDDPVGAGDIVGVVVNVGAHPMRVPYLGRVTMLFRGG
jgi:signal peptidase